MKDIRAAKTAAALPAVLGLDLGSTGSKAVLTSLATGEPIHDVYDRTRGNPVNAAQRLVQTMTPAAPSSSPMRSARWTPALSFCP